MLLPSIPSCSFSFVVFVSVLLQTCFSFQLTPLSPKNYPPGASIDTTVNTISPFIGDGRGSDIFNYECTWLIAHMKVHVFF